MMVVVEKSYNLKSLFYGGDAALQNNDFRYLDFCGVNSETSPQLILIYHLQQQQHNINYNLKRLPSGLEIKIISPSPQPRNPITSRQGWGGVVKKLTKLRRRIGVVLLISAIKIPA